ncbi:MAG: hypothetical protein R3C31_13815 [Hyphomonadaceae bacterium]
MKKMSDKELVEYVAYMAMQLADLTRKRLPAITAALEFAAFLAQERISRSR